MKLKIFTFCILCGVLSLSNISFAQHHQVSPYFSTEALESLNESLPPHLSIDKTGKLLENQSRMNLYLLDSAHHFNWDASNATWEMSARHYATLYDVQGNLLELSIQERDANTGNFELSALQQYQYNTNGFDILEFNWNGATWDTIRLDKYEFNSNGYVTLWEIQVYDGITLQWSPVNKEETTYNSANARLTHKGYTGDHTTNTWLPNYDYNYTYNNNDQLIELNLQSTFINNVWMFRSRYNYSYDMNGDLTLQEHYLWESSSSSFILDDQLLVTIDAINNTKEEINQSWNPSTQTFTNDYKTVYTYNANNQAILMIREDWDNNQWVLDVKSDFTYNSNGQQALQEFFQWLNGAWAMRQRLLNNYDNHGNQLRFETQEIDANTGVVLFGFAIDYFYSLNPTNTQKLYSESLQAYPNPTSGTVLVTLPNDFTQGQLTIWDMQGRLLQSQDYQGELIDLSTYSNGVYWLQIISDDSRYTMKVIKN